MSEPNEDVAYYCLATKGEYFKLACRCADSFRAYGLQVHLGLIQQGKTWMESCKCRARHLCEAVDISFEQDLQIIGLLDSDLICQADPVLLKTQGDWDVAVHDLTDIGRLPDHRSQRYSAGVLAFSLSKHGRECLRRWADLCDTDPEPTHELREQVYLYTAIEEMRKAGGRVFNLGDRYNRTPERVVDGDDTVIVHHVASRRLKQSHGGGR